MEKAYMTKELKNVLKVDVERCTGCRCCQVRCSIINLGEFNPFKSNIRIRRHNGLRTTEICFTEKCIHCGLCAKVCNYGALALYIAL